MKGWDRLGLPIAWSSAQEIVVVKPPGIAVELTRDPRGESVVARVRGVTGAEAYLPHRLDRVTRGLVVVALSVESAAWHGGEIESGGWTKVYLARVKPRQGVDVRGLIGEHRAYLRQRGMHAEIVRAGGKPSRLVIEGAWPAPDRAGEWHVLVRLLTGRFHQVRAMMAHLGAPVVGDEAYGGVRGSMYLEHAALRFTPMGATAPVTVFDPRDPDREGVADEALRAIERVVTGG